jgi:hypothetical protein
MPTTKSDAELKVDVLDVHILDVLAQVEGMLRHLREVQRCALRVRGVPSSTHEDELAAMKAAQHRVATMHADSDALRAALRDIGDVVDELIVCLSNAHSQ